MPFWCCKSRKITKQLIFFCLFLENVHYFCCYWLLYHDFLYYTVNYMGGNTKRWLMWLKCTSTVINYCEVELIVDLVIMVVQLYSPFTAMYQRNFFHSRNALKSVCVCVCVYMYTQACTCVLCAPACNTTLILTALYF